MNLQYQFRTVTGRFCLEQIRMALSEEYDFVYAPHLQGGWKLFREVTPDMRNYLFPFKVLLFYFVVEPDAPYTDHIARQDIYSGLEYLSIVGWGTLLWGWQICEWDNQEQGDVPIYYKYDIDGDNHHIFYDRLLAIPSGHYNA